MNSVQKAVTLSFTPAVPARLLPVWAAMWAVPIGPVGDYCGRLTWDQKLPRGAERRLKSLRGKIIRKIRGEH